MIGVFSPGIEKIPCLEPLLGDKVRRLCSCELPVGITAIAGWGLRDTARKARSYARRHRLPYLALEDGFLRSLGLGGSDAPLSLLVDDIGIYYDASRESRLENLVSRSLAAAEAKRADDLIGLWRRARVSKYNHLREYEGELPGRYVLVVDQTAGDASLVFGGAGPHSFQHMLAAAIADNPDCRVVVKIHPDVFAGKKRGCFVLADLLALPGIMVIAEDVHPVRLIASARRVYCVTSQMGFEALLWGRPVFTFGMPFYAGWGLTQDALPAPTRRQPASLLQLVHAALIDYPRYLHPESRERCEVEALLDWMALQRKMRGRFPPTVFALGFSRWKKPVLKDYFQGSRIRFVRKVAQVPAAATLVVWGARDPGVLADGVRLLRVEDGFLRSVGLGADLVRPVSWVVDDLGLYCDATRVSRLEQILAGTDFDADLLGRAAALRRRIVASGLTKYNVGTASWHRPGMSRRVILVPGQVEADVSLRLGAPGLNRNADLLKAVRQANPEALLLYKPHPDVVAGLRKGGKTLCDSEMHCDVVVLDVPMANLLDQVDELHTLTSLAGFEALLRGKKVVCYGLPFYAGWGLTQDMISMPQGRRGRSLHLDQLVAATLLLYPAYVSRHSRRFISAESALDELLAWRLEGVSCMPWWRRLLRWLLVVFARVKGR